MNSCTKGKIVPSSICGIIPYVVLILVAALSSFIALKNIKITSDSISYGLAAQQIIAGNGIRIPIVWFESNLPMVNGAVPYITQPPLLPVLFALSGGIGPHNYLAAQILNLICHVAVSIFTFMLMKHFCSNRTISLLTGILVATSYPLVRSSHQIWSEPLFIVLTMAAAYFLILSRNYISRNTKYILFASTCAFAAVFTRWAGIALIAVFLLEAVHLLKNKRSGRHTTAFFALTIPITAPVILFARNYMATSNIVMTLNEPRPERSLFSAFTGTMEMLLKQFQLGTLSSAFVMIFSLLFLVYLIIDADVRAEVKKYLKAGLDTILCLIISYVALICLAMVQKQPRFELRFMYPLVPFMFIVGILMINSTVNSLKTKGYNKLSLTVLVVSLSLITFGNGYKTFINMPEFMNKQERIDSFLNSCMYNWILEHNNKDVIIATNEPYRLSFFGGYSTLRLLTNKWDLFTRIPEDMESALPKRMSETGAQMLVLFSEVKEEHYGSYIARLFRERTSDDKFILAHECSDGVAYSLRE